MLGSWSTLTEEGSEGLGALLWGDELSSADRDALRWLTVREGGLPRLGESAAEALRVTRRKSTP
jgi:hypothetical protein